MEIQRESNGELVNAPITDKLTYGQELVGVKFNPSGLTEVDKIKLIFANMIDDIHNQGTGNAVKADIAKEAIMQLKTACMYTVNFHVI